MKDHLEFQEAYQNKKKRAGDLIPEICFKK